MICRSGGRVVWHIMLVIFDWELWGILDSERELRGWKKVTTLIHTATTRRVGGQERESESERAHPTHVGRIA